MRARCVLSHGGAPLTTEMASRRSPHDRDALAAIPSTPADPLPSPQHQCIKNLAAILEAAGTTLEKVVKVNVFLASIDDFAAMNSVYATYWGDIKPCRT